MAARPTGQIGTRAAAGQPICTGWQVQIRPSTTPNPSPIPDPRTVDPPHLPAPLGPWGQRLSRISLGVCFSDPVNDTFEKSP
ncbi:hypothetical protein BJX96DRAFT_179956 [Aspergillus floccosus]